ncbi:hypothetical protein chiPu_0005445 [Chiloscyllium punctatum]|uniref:Uncharacterized protein n=1 Tax=Chiloscyllium punctatum TaxID=137246 RepID=A0A401S9I0_CHIPU|nr:hypothetical protein [Chiloscyllium punctatum]
MVDIGNKQLQLNISEDDDLDLLESQAEELTSEDLMELEQQMIAFEEERLDLETPEPKKLLMNKLTEAFHLIEAGMAKLEEQDLNAERFTKVYRIVIDGLSCYKTICNKKKESSVQATLRN